MDDDRVLLKTILGAVYNLKKQKQRPSDAKIVQYLKNRCNYTEAEILGAVRQAVDEHLVVVDGKRRGDDIKKSDISYRVAPDNSTQKNEKESDRKKMFLKKNLQDIFLSKNTGLTLADIEPLVVSMSQPFMQLFRDLNDFKVHLRLALFEGVNNGMFIQSNNTFVIDEHKRVLSQNLWCSSCKARGTLLDICHPFIFCYSCGRGFHFFCVLPENVNISFCLATGWLCPECKACQICFVNDDRPLNRCSQCDKGFHKNCSSEVLQYIFDEKLCDCCNTRMYLTGLFKRPARPENALPLLHNTVESRADGPLNVRRKSVNKSSRRKRDRTKNKSLQTILPFATPPPPPPDMLEKLFKSKKFPDITEEDISLFRSVQDVVQSKIKQIRPDPESKNPTPPYIQLGKYEIKCWYSSPFPQEYATVSKLYICEFCLEYRKTEDIMKLHLSKCCALHPPDREIYRNNDLSIFEVDGQNFKNYCQNLCLIAKLFLDHKTLYYDVEPFLFYVLTKRDEYGCHLVAYFSKEKFSPQKHNVSCITTLPPYQRSGYGRFLIDFSYLLTREEQITGSPEKPLSILGKLSYQSYWNSTICSYLKNSTEKFHTRIKDIMEHTGMDPHDISYTLHRLGMVKINKEKKCIINIKNHIIEKYLSSNSYVNRIQIDPIRLRWSPYLKPSIHEEQPPDQEVITK